MHEFCFRPRTLRTAEISSKCWKRALWVAAPNSGTHQVLARKRYPEGPKIKKIRDFDRDWKFRSRMKFSSEPPTAALFFWEIETSRLKFSSEIKNFDRDWKFRSRSTLIFHSLVFRQKPRKSTQNTKDFLPLSTPGKTVKPWKNWEKLPKTLETPRNFLGLKRPRKIKTPRNGRSGKCFWSLGPLGMSRTV